MIKGELRVQLTENELIITDRFGTSMMMNKYILIDPMGEKHERLEIYPVNASELDDKDDFTVDVPINEFTNVIDIIKDRFGVK